MDKQKYTCIRCNFNTSNLKDYNRHLNTKKHNKNTKNTIKEIYKCECGKGYKYRGSLYNHKKKCDKSIQGIQKEITDLKNIVLDIIPKMNNKISINVFLNEYCKDALDFNDFLKKIHISFEDLILTRELGYSQGISQIFLNRLKGLEQFERPIHCTDIKRKQFYIKENENWNLDNGQSVVKAIDMISTKQLIHLNKIKDNDSFTNKQDEFINLTNNITGGNKEQKEKSLKETIKLIGINTSIKKALN
tara:strand:+ start:90 stop:830 length:741 start_codon:yes stop_codon:yes gene_type:complete